MMDRRQFVKSLALLAAGAAALPEQIDVFERYYEANTPKTALPLLAVDEVSISGMATRSTRVAVDFFAGDELKLRAGLNAFGGIYFWRSPPDGKIVTPKLRWVMTSPDVGGEDLLSMVHSSISYLDQGLVRRTLPLLSCEGVLA